MASKPGKSKNVGPKLRIIPLGGMGEIGKNLTVFEYDEDIIVVDMGSLFPREDMPGVDLVIPDVTYLTKNASRIRAYFITHGPEDHIGAAPYILKQLPAPVYGTRLTLALIEHKLKEHHVNDIQLNVVKPGYVVEAGKFEVEFIHVNHSITEPARWRSTRPSAPSFTPATSRWTTPHRRPGDGPGPPRGAGQRGRIGAAGRLHQRGAARLHHERAHRGRGRSTTSLRRRRGASSSRCLQATCTASSRWWTPPSATTEKCA